MLEVTALRKSYGNLVAVDGVSLRAGKGETIGLLGPNGAGKTSTVSMIAGLLRPDSGEVLIDGRALSGDTDPAKRRIGLVPQDLGLYDEMSARENLHLFGALYGLDGAHRKHTSAAMTSMLVLMILFAFARVVFGVRIQGSMLGFLGVCAAFSLMTASFGLMIAALGKTPEATRALSIIVTLLMVMLGGAWVPTFVFPQWMQKLTVVIPTRWAMDGLDAVTWRGLGFSAVAVPIALLSGCALLFGLLAANRFRWEDGG